MAATYMLLLPATAWALSGSVTPVAPVTPVTPAVASTATRVGSIVARIQNALDEACATEAASAGAAPAPLAVGALATACGRRELAARLRAKHYAVLRLPGFGGGSERRRALLGDDAALLRVGGAAPVAPDRPAEFVGVFGGDGPGRFAEGRYGGDGRAAGPRGGGGPARRAVVFGAHTDTSFFTLVPLSSPPGLEVFDPSLDAWVRPEAAGAEATGVLCMPGEFLELASAARAVAELPRPASAGASRPTARATSRARTPPAAASPRSRSTSTTARRRRGLPDLGLTVAPAGDAIFVRDARTPLLRADRFAVAAHAAARREELPVEAGVKPAAGSTPPVPGGAPSNDGD
ncbi:oxidoreductase [Aureococcus anophagefferens]|nr:oxidoreductase [Aureococcus anophagefferens]